MLIESCKVKTSAVCTVSIERFLSVLQFFDLTRIKGGGSITHIQRLIAGEGPPEDKPLYEDFVDQIMQPAPNEPGAVRARFLAYLQAPDKNYQLPSPDKDMPFERESHKGHKVCKAIIKNLWDLLKQDIDPEKIVKLLKEFEQIVPLIFSAVIIDELKYADVKV